MKYRKKPAVVEAFQWTGQPKTEWPAWFVEEWHRIKMTSINGCACMVIPTLEGDMTAAINDWIIRGVNWEIYPCKPDIFEKTYEAAQ